jgi:hypothetical protein
VVNGKTIGFQKIPTGGNCFQFDEKETCLLVKQLAFPGLTHVDFLVYMLVVGIYIG